jgi:hypothetical protein
MCGWGLRTQIEKPSFFYKRAAKRTSLFKVKSVGFCCCFSGVRKLKSSAYFERSDKNENFVVLNFKKKQIGKLLHKINMLPT